MHVVELSYVSRHLFLTDLLSASTFTLYYLCTHFTHTLTIVFLCKGISESTSREAEKKREKLLQLSTIKGAVSADGDGKRIPGVDDLSRNEPPSQVLALTSRCQMWLHVAYGV